MRSVVTLWGPARTQKRLSSARQPFLKAGNVLLGHMEEKYSPSCLQMDYAKEDHTAQLNELLTEGGLQSGIGGRSYCAGDTLYPFFASFMDRSRGLLEK